MDTNNLIKSVIQENIVESKKIATELLMQKLSERLQNKFEEFAPETFLDEAKEELDPVGEEDEDINNDGKEDETDEYLKNRRAAIARSMGKKDEEEDEDEEEEGDEDEEEDEEDEEMGEDGLVYEYGKNEAEGETSAEEMNQKAFKRNGLDEQTEQLDEVSPPGMKHMTHSKKAKEAFKEKYGKRGKSVQYATAWKKAEKKD